MSCGSDQKNPETLTLAHVLPDNLSSSGLLGRRRGVSLFFVCRYCRKKTVCSKCNIPETLPVHRPTVKHLCNGTEFLEAKIYWWWWVNLHRFLPKIYSKMVFLHIMSRSSDWYIWICKNFWVKIILIWTCGVLMFEHSSLCCPNGDKFAQWRFGLYRDGVSFLNPLGQRGPCWSGPNCWKDPQGLHLEQCLGNWWGWAELHRKICPAPACVRLPSAKAIKLMLI